MHENEAINLRQWNRQNEYNSPAEQMKRLKLAGLNPDLAIGGSPQNTADSAQLTDGTPQAPGAASAVGSAVRNAQEAALLQSQVRVNESQADKNSAQAGEASSHKNWMDGTLEGYMEQLSANIGFTKEQTALATQQIEFVQMQSYQLSKSIEEMNARISLLTQQRFSEVQRTRKLALDSDMAAKMLRQYDTIIDADISKTISEIGLNEASAANYRVNTHQLWATMKSIISIAANQSNQSYHQGLYWQAMNQYQRALNTQMNEHLKFLPYYYGSLMFDATKYAKRDKDGNIVIDPKTGWPQYRESAQGFQVLMEQGQQLLGNLESVTRSVYNVGAAYGQMRTGVSLPTPKVGFSTNGQSQPAQMYHNPNSGEREATKQEAEMFSRWYDSKPFDEAFNDVQAYKRKHNIY